MSSGHRGESHQRPIDERVHAQLEALMGDRIFQQALQRYTVENDKNDVAFLAGSEHNGTTIDFDKDFAKAIHAGAVKYDGKPFDPRPYIKVHEAVEGAILRKRFEPGTWTLQMPGVPAHEVALCAERMAVEHAGLDWSKYLRSTDRFIKQDDARIKNPPPHILRTRPVSAKVATSRGSQMAQWDDPVQGGARLTAAGRRALPASDFALGKGHYPIDTANRARNALARGAQNASPAQQATIKRKVKARYPSIQVGARSREDHWPPQHGGHSVWHHGSGVQFGDRMPSAPGEAGDRDKSYAETKKERIGSSKTQQSGARQPPSHMHALAMASATHLHRMGHIDGAMKNKIHTHSKNKLAAMGGPSVNAQMPPPGPAPMAPIPSFGSMAPPDGTGAMPPPGMVGPAGASAAGPQFGARMKKGGKYPKYGAQHYMSTPTPTGSDEDW